MNINTIPSHVAIIMDGNGRWAETRHLSRSDGHKAGFENLKKLSQFIFDCGVKTLSVFAFSTENFKRSKQEVDYLMNLFTKAFEEEFNLFHKENIKIVFSGRREPLSKKVWTAMQKIQEKTQHNTRGILNICINYGGHAEIIDACQKYCQEVLEQKSTVQSLTEETFSHYLYQELDPIDFLIRTSGEERVSNFMLWQMSYAEFYFPKIYFPDFGEKQFEEAIIEYQKRTRKFGGIQYDKTSA